MSLSESQLSSEATDDASDITKCSNCLNACWEPIKLSTCTHQYCSPCVKHVSKTSDDGEEAHCPQCRHNNPQIELESLLSDVKHHRPAGMHEDETRKEGSEEQPARTDKCDSPTDSSYSSWQSGLSDAERPDVSKIQCDLCLAGSGVRAKRRCTDCNQNMCVRCATSHSRTRVAENHKIEDIPRRTGKMPVQKRSSCCDKHEEQLAGLYCENCGIVLCNTCALTEHREHTFVEVRIAAEDFDIKLRSSLPSVEEYGVNGKRKREQLEKKKNELLEHASNIENRINEKSDKLHEMIDAEGGQLQVELNASKERKMKEMQTFLDEINENLAYSEDLIAQLKVKGSDHDICRKAKGLLSEVEAVKNKQKDATGSTFDPNLGTFIQAVIPEVREKEIRLIGVYKPTDTAWEISQSLGQNNIPMVINNVFDKQQQEINGLDKERDTLREENETQRKKYEKIIKQQKNELESLHTEKKKLADMHNTRNNQLEVKVQELECTCLEKNDEICGLKKDIEQRKRKEQQLQAEVKDEKHKVAQKDKELQQLREKYQHDIQASQERRRNADVETDLRKQLDEQRVENGLLKQTVESLELKLERETSCEKMEYNFKKVNLKDLHNLLNFLKGKDWAMQFYDGAEAFYIAVHEPRRDEARQELQRVRMVNNLPIKFVKPRKMTLQYTMGKPGINICPKNAQVARNDSCPHIPELRPSQSIECVQNGCSALFGGAIRLQPGTQEYGLFPAHLIDELSHNDCIVSVNCSRECHGHAIGECYVVFDGKSHGASQSAERGLEDVALILLNNQKCTAKNVICFEDQIEHGLTLLRGIFIERHTVVVFIDQDGISKTGKVYHGTYSDMSCVPPLFNTLAITDLQGKTHLQRQGDSGALVLQKPTQAEERATDVTVLGMVSSIIRPQVISSEYPESLTIANNLGYVVDVNFLSGRMEFSNDHAAANNNSAKVRKYKAVIILRNK